MIFWCFGVLVFECLILILIFELLRMVVNQRNHLISLISGSDIFLSESGFTGLVGLVYYYPFNV